ncbi:LEA type 2 family protein [Bdellovibrio sp. HCB290]|uniref:LEA type 2 family protein n=1 Tax=Bdellovibrio sp. HCB290 TaxID=3394356 RepID=UPI0039B53F5B
MRTFALLVVVVFIGGCSFFKDRYGQKPEIDLANIHFENTTPLSTTMVFVLNVKNPNKIDLNVEELSYEIQLDQKEFAKARSDKQIKIPAGQSAQVELPLPVNFLKAVGGITKVLSGQDVGYEITGEAKVSGIKLPFNEKGLFNMNGVTKKSE